MLAQHLGAFVESDQVPQVWAEVARLFRDYGYRRPAATVVSAPLDSHQAAAELVAARYQAARQSGWPAPAAAVPAWQHS